MATSFNYLLTSSPNIAGVGVGRNCLVGVIFVGSKSPSLVVGRSGFSLPSSDDVVGSISVDSELDGDDEDDDKDDDDVIVFDSVVVT